MDAPRDDTIPTMAQQVFTEAGAVFSALAPDTADRLCDELTSARRIACFGVGREGLMIRAFCMRLMHLGFDAHVVGDMSTPPIGPGDVLIISAGPGEFSTALALQGVARDAGARTVVVTAQPDGDASRLADTMIHLPAQTMANDLDRDATPSLLPMGSLFELAELVFFDLVAILLQRRTGQSPELMRGRHTNLE
jgi:6-phospho-3-hexuloisomerase